jgi:hypothetical protein
MANFKPLPPLAELEADFDYDAGSGLLLRDGKQAGGVNSLGYRVVSVGQCKYKVHRIAYYLGNKTDPGKLTVDHINGIRDDNRLANLRLATRREQQRNRSYKGASFDKNAGKWKSKIRIEGISVFLGSFDSEGEASAEYHKAAAAVFGRFKRAG